MENLAAQHNEQHDKAAPRKGTHASKCRHITMATAPRASRSHQHRDRENLVPRQREEAEDGEEGGFHYFLFKKSIFRESKKFSKLRKGMEMD